MLSLVLYFPQRIDFAFEDLEDLLNVGNKYPFLWALMKKRLSAFKTFEEIKKVYSYC
jgi:hypothetical protein